MTRRKTGIFGGTFNPIHYGHLRAAEEVRQALGLERIIYIPSGNPPLKESGLATADHRYEMVRLAVKTNRLFALSDIEVRRRGKSYTLETVLSLREVYREDEFYLILGIDSFLEMPLWYKPEMLMGLTDIVVISRPGYGFTDIFSQICADKGILEQLDRREIDVYKTKPASADGSITLLNVSPIAISATEIRELAGEGKSIKYLLPEAVESYIISNRLYLEGSDRF